MKKGEKAVVIAVGISFLAHGLFFASSNFFLLSGMSRVRDETRTVFRIKGVEEEPTPVKLFAGFKPEVPAVKMSREHPAAEMGEQLPEEKAEKDVSLAEKKDRLRREDLDEFFTEEKPVPPDVRDIEEAKARQDAAPEERSLLRQRMDSDIVSALKGDVTVLRSMDYKMEEQGFKRADAVIDTRGRSAEGFFRPGKSEFAGIMEQAQPGEHEDISTFLAVKVYRYEEPVTGEKYFKLVISAKEGSDLEVMPKEVIFLIDSSKSITADKLSRVKAAVMDCLREMNADDRFNIVAFRGDLAKFRDRSVKVSPGSIAEAGTFVKQLRSIGQTDVDNALLKIVDAPLAFSPSYIMLVTDGRPTAGITDSRRIIRQITRRNNMKRSIFSFGGGARVNRYLLDFISYQNRGWSRFAGRTSGIEEEFRELYRQIRSPLLLNVRYRLIGVDAGSVYPKYLPDFYKGSEFILYGRFKDEDVFSMQLLGEMDGETKELIFRRSLAGAEQGDRALARGWAFRKIYYLISRDTIGAGDHARLRREIDELSEKYDIITPYDLVE